MRFIGSKKNLLDEINLIVENHCVDAKSFCDIFSGTACVAKFFKEKYKIISNDLLYFSFVLQRATIENNEIPLFDNLNKTGIKNPLEFFNNYIPNMKDLEYNNFIHQNYSPKNGNETSYFTEENAIKIDYIRQTINKWKKSNLINESEYYYLIACLIESVPFVSNIAGTYGAYLKHWDKRAFKKIELLELDVINNKKKNISYNIDSNLLIKNISGDILYIDPPYNSRQYLPNYHVLETISKYDNPKIYGKTGLRPYSDIKSNYCIKNKVLSEFSYLIKNANFRYIIVSYSSEGIMKENEIKDILIENGIKSTYKFKQVSYRRYKHIKNNVKHDLKEFIFFITKNI